MPGQAGVDLQRRCRLPADRAHGCASTTQREKVVDFHIRFVHAFKKYRSIITQTIVIKSQLHSQLFTCADVNVKKKKSRINSFFFTNQ